MNLNQITIIKRKVKYPRLELKTGKPVLILSQKEKINPMTIITRHQKWFEKKLEFIKNLKKKYKNQKIYQRSKDELINLVIKSIKEFSKILKIEPERISFRTMKTKWGSCSKKRKICLNLMLKHLPVSLIRYVVFHEMIHLIIPKHNKNFWLYIKKKFKNYQLCEERLFGYWFLLNEAFYKKNNIK